MSISESLFKPIYTFVDKDGTNTHIDTDALREWTIKAKPEIFNGPLDHSLARSFILDNVVSRSRLTELHHRLITKDPTLIITPIIMAKDGTFSESNGAPNVLLVDGHHRYVLACMAGLHFIESHVLSESEWRPFQLHNLPSITHAQLLATPFLKRHY